MPLPSTDPPLRFDQNSSSEPCRRPTTLPFTGNLRLRLPLQEEAILHAAHIGRPGFGILPRVPAKPAELAMIYLEKLNQGTTLHFKDIISKTNSDLHELLSSSNAIQFFSAITLSEEDLGEKSSHFMGQGVLSGIEITVGEIPLDLLALFCYRCHAAGACFVTCRAVFRIGEAANDSIQEIARELAACALTVQRNGLAAILHPDITIDQTHNIQKCYENTQTVLELCYAALKEHNVFLGGTLLIINPVCPGSTSLHLHDNDVTAQLISAHTFSVLIRNVPKEVPSVFISSGRSEQESLIIYSDISKITAPWSISFYFGHALLGSTLRAWKGKEENMVAAQDVFSGVCSLCSGKQDLGLRMIP
ncbi:Fructose-bisphosphate aldolase 8, cytosolic [Cardamine amara subsp. amara]|uniref:fructose-bisphosphate aldolase n=1 Tax=Cardamine amara subsp. amara TaxID=228776 RepID=A0ABD1AB68_CARAN